MDNDITWDYAWTNDVPNLFDRCAEHDLPWTRMPIRHWETSFRVRRGTVGRVCTTCYRSLPDAKSAGRSRAAQAVGRPTRPRAWVARSATRIKEALMGEHETGPEHTTERHHSFFEKI